MLRKWVVAEEEQGRIVIAPATSLPRNKCATSAERLVEWWLVVGVVLMEVDMIALVGNGMRAPRLASFQVLAAPRPE